MSEVLFLLSSAKERMLTNGEPQTALPPGLQKWSPSGFELRPVGLPRFPFAVWGLFTTLRIFRNPDYSIYLYRNGASVVHRSCVFPPYFRFPFMNSTDLQIGDIWTAEAWRGKGLALTTLSTILRAFPDRNIWFLCEAGNQASVALAKRAGMKVIGSGFRKPRFGVSFLGHFQINPDAAQLAAPVKR